MVVGERFVSRGLSHIQEPGGGDVARLEVTQHRILVGFDLEDNAIQVGIALRRLVILGIAHYGVVIAAYTLVDHPRSTGDRGMQALRRLEQLVHRNVLVDMLGHGTGHRIRPDRDEGLELGREVEGDRQFVGGDMRRLDQFETDGTGGRKFGIVIQAPGEINIVSG